MPDAGEGEVAAVYAQYAAFARKCGAELAALRGRGADAEERIAFIAHPLKGSAPMIGDNSLLDALVAWRDEFKRDPAAAEALWPALEREFAAI